MTERFDRPDPYNCCICRDAKPEVTEVRETGRDLSLEAWFYCLDCWAYMVWLREQPLTLDLLEDVA